VVHSLVLRGSEPSHQLAGPSTAAGMALVPCRVRPCPSLRVVFPLPNGSVTVFLRPEVRSGGTLTLLSPIGPFGTDGAYLVVTESDRAHGWAKRVPLSEQFVLSPNDDGSVQADHDLTMWKIPVFHLRYQLTVP
jgi:hypothetical protein